MPPDDDARDQPNDPDRWQREAARKLDDLMEGRDHYAIDPPNDEMHGFESDPVVVSGTDLRPYDSPSVGGPVAIGNRTFATGDQWHHRWRSRVGLGGPSGCAVSAAGLALLALVALLIIYLLAGGGDDGDDALVSGGGTEVSATADPESSASPAATTEATTVPTAAPPELRLLQIGEAVIDQILEELYFTTDLSDDELDYVEDQLLDFLDSISSNTPSYTSPVIDMRLYGGVRAKFTDAGILEAWGNTIYECGDASDGRIVVCPADAESMPAAGGDVWMFAMAFEEAVPQAAPDRSFVYSAVFDSDGDPANDWQFKAGFDFDLFQGADRWYQLVWDHGTAQWLISVTQVSASQQPTVVPSAVRAVIEDDTIVFFIPASEFQLDAPPYRLTSFGHDGTFNEADRGADVSGVDPTAPLTVPSDEVYLAMPEDR